MNDEPVRLPSVVEHLSYRTLIDPRLLVDGDRFLYAGKTWTVAEMDGAIGTTPGGPVTRPSNSYFLPCCWGITGTQAGVPSSHLSLVIGRWSEPSAFITKSSA